MNNKNPVEVGPTSTSSGGQVENFSLSVTGPGLDGIMLSQNMVAKTFLNIGFDQGLFTNGLIGSKINVSSELPAKAIKIRPDNFLLTAGDSSKKVNIVIPSLKKLEKIKEVNDLFGGQIPDSITLTVTQTTQGMVFTKDFEIPISSQ